MAHHYAFMRLANALYINGPKYAYIPYHPAFNFGIQAGYTISAIFRAGLNPTVPAIAVRGDGAMNHTTLQLDYDATTIRAGFVNNMTGGNPNNVPFAILLQTVAFPVARLKTEWVQIDMVKKISNPTGNIPVSDIQLYINGLLPTQTPLVSGSIAASMDATSNENFLLVRSTGGGNNAQGYLADFKIYNRALTAFEIYDKFIREGRWMVQDNTGIVDFRFQEKNGKSIKNYLREDINGVLTGYTDAETASNGQPQSGNTAWYNANQFIPITS